MARGGRGWGGGEGHGLVGCVKGAWGLGLVKGAWVVGGVKGAWGWGGRVKGAWGGEVCERGIGCGG